MRHGTVIRIVWGCKLGNGFVMRRFQEVGILAEPTNCTSVIQSSLFEVIQSLEISFLLRCCLWFLY